MDLNLEDVWLEMGCHRDAGDADTDSREGVERGDIRGRFDNGVLSSRGTVLVVLVLRGERPCSEPTPNRLRLETHSN